MRDRIILASKGLSPRVRGNLRPESRESGSEGSIPACAGNLSYGNVTGQPNGVYPRVCGGTCTTLQAL